MEERLDFPEGWRITVVEIAGADAPVLTVEEMRNKVGNPIKTRPLRDIAYGKKTAVVTFDDLTRPTPVNTVAPFVIEELKGAASRMKISSLLPLMETTESCLR